MQVLCSVDSVEKALQEAKRVLKPGGRLWIQSCGCRLLSAADSLRLQASSCLWSTPWRPSAGPCCG